MTRTNNGGPAFPRPASKGNNYITGEEDIVVDGQQGMTLRDYFAAKAMQGELANDASWGNDVLPKLAGRAYAIADAMLAAREK